MIMGPRRNFVANGFRREILAPRVFCIAVTQPLRQLQLRDQTSGG
jgi:hypothetical protein